MMKNNAFYLLFILALLMSCNDDDDAMPMAYQNPALLAGLIETTDFQLNDGVTAAEALTAVDAMNAAFLADLEGFIYRSFTQKNDSVWTDVVFWSDEVAFNNAFTASQSNTEAGAFLGLIDLNSVNVSLNPVQLNFGPSQSDIPTQNPISKASIVEATSFQLVANIADSEILKAAEAMNTAFLNRTDGFIFRSLTKQANGTWVDIIHWESETAFNNAFAASQSSTEAEAFLSFIDLNSVNVQLHQINSTFGK